MRLLLNLPALLVCLAAFFISCEKGLQPGEKSLGMASIIQLQPESTTVYLRDYFPGQDSLSILKLPDGLKAGELINGETIKLFGNLSKVYEIIEVQYGESKYSLPVRKSRKQKVQLSFHGTGDFKSVSVKGSFNGWVASRNPMTATDSGWFTDLWLDEGRHQYLLVLDDNETLDPANTDSISNGMGGYNSLLMAGTPDSRGPEIFTKKYDADRRVVAIGSTAPLEQLLVFWQNRQLSVDSSGSDFIVKIPAFADEMALSHIRILASSKGKAANELIIPLLDGEVAMNAQQLPREDYRSMMMYFLMVDRFFNADSSNDKPVKDTIVPLANYMGGDLAGIIKKIEEGYFDQLGMNAIWLSPIGQNPEGAWGRFDRGGIMTKFSGYHGYWPVSHSQVDYRFGNAEDLKSVISGAQYRNMNLLLDYVANHVHQNHPMLKVHPDWHTPMILPDGTRNLERWDEHRLTTWFDTFLPTLDLEREEVRSAAADSAMFWVKNFNIDGLRHDATKHIPEEYWRLLTRRIKNEAINQDRKAFYQVGETYGSAELIGSYIGSGMMDGQFDFNLYDAAVACFASPTEPMTRLGNTLQQSLDYYGPHHMMANISGNQDKVRFISYADGSVRFDEDTKLAGYTRKIEVRYDSAYAKLAMLHAFNFTIPGIPVVYYGDEIGLPGANDPDNRRMMKFDSLTKPQRKLKSTVSKLAQFRRRSMALNYGSTGILLQNESVLVIDRSYFGSKVIIAFNKGPTQNILIDYDAASNIALTSFNGNPFSFSNGRLSIKLPHNSFEIIYTLSKSE